MNIRWTLALCIGLIAGCGQDTNPGTPNADDRGGSGSGSASQAADPQAAPAPLSVTGAETMELDYTLRFSCVRDTVSILTMTQSPRFTMFLPSTIEAGSYALADYDANADPKYVENKAVVTFTGAVQRGSGSTYGNVYFKSVDGELIIERMPEGRGDRFVADLDATLADGDGATVNLTGRIDIEETGSMTMDCQY